MYWWTNYHIKKTFQTAGAIALAVVLLSACSQQQHNASETAYEIDLPSYFKGEIESLTKQNPKITKTVFKDIVKETKSLHINDWERELGSFLAVDINKPAYKGLYTKDSTDNLVRYQFTKSDISQISIEYQEGVPAVIQIEKSVKNLLYNSTEKITYASNQFYTIDKEQEVKVLGTNKYKIEGILGDKK